MSAVIITFPRAPLAFHVAIKSGLSRSEAHALERAKRAAKERQVVPQHTHTTALPEPPEAA